MTKQESIVFLGAGPVALGSLKALHEVFEIEAVISKPDPKSSRAPRLVADYAREHNLPLLQPENKNQLDEMVAEASFQSRLGIVVDYGMIILDETLLRFELGIVNSHFSLLPEWRGADPITFSLLSGQKQTGVSIMKIVAEMDAGDLLAQAFYDIDERETIHSLTDNLVELSNQTLVEVLPKYLSGQIQPYPQDDTQEPTFSRKLSKQDGEIDWTKPAEQIEREIRAFSGWPGSYTTLGETDVIITEAYVNPGGREDLKPGEFEYVKPAKALMIQTGSGQIVAQRLKPKGKQEMDAASFYNGYLR